MTAIIIGILVAVGYSVAWALLRAASTSETDERYWS